MYFYVFGLFVFECKFLGHIYVISRFLCEAMKDRQFTKTQQ